MATKSVEKTLIEQEIGLNPFLVPLKIRTKRFLQKGTITKDEHGDYQGVEVTVDAHQHTRVFIDSFIRKALMTLKPLACQVFVYLIYKCPNATSHMTLDLDKFCKEAELKDLRPVRAAVKELVKLRIIVESVKKDVYWINPEYLHNGSRVLNFPNNLIEPELPTTSD